MKPSILCLVLIAPLVAACGARDSSDAAQVIARAQALAIPVPYSKPGDQTGVWNRSYVDLMVADTWATCSFLQNNNSASDMGAPSPNPPINHKLISPGDQYLDQLLTAMDQAKSYWVANATHPNESSYDQQQWIDYRNDPNYNRNRSTGAAQGAGLSLRNLTRYTLTLSDPNFVAAQSQGSQTVALAAMNTCIAQGVRSLSLGADTMALSEAEQIQALEVVRERAQIAMLQYAAIFNAIASPSGNPLTPPATTYQAVAYLQQWAATTTNKSDFFSAWMNDFAAAVQLHLAATTELTDLFIRSAAAKSPRGGAPQTAGDQEWGAGSWRQRLLALLYGGDPLATAADGSTPWVDMLGRTAPGVALDTTVRSADAWPTSSELPYFTVETRDPHVAQLLALARRADARRLLNKADGSADIDASAERMYRAVEALVRTEQCTAVNDGGCATVALTDVPSWSAVPSLDSYLLFKNFGVTQENAKTAAAYLDQYAPTNALSAIHAVGALELVSDAAGTWRHIPREAADIPRTIDEVSPLFERYAPYRIPATVDPNVERAHLETTASSVTYRIGDDQGLGASGLYAESMRVLGAMPALSLIRDVISRVSSSSTAPSELKTALTNIGAGLNGTIDAAIGKSVTRVSPLETVRHYDWANSGVMGGRLAWERLQTTWTDRTTGTLAAGWALDTDVAPTDAFFACGVAATYDVVAVRNRPAAWVLALATSGSSSPIARGFDGKSFTDFLTDAANTVVSTSAALNWGDSQCQQGGKLHAELRLPAQTLSTSPPSTWTFVARKTVGTSVTYFPITAAVPIYTWQFNRISAMQNSDAAPILSFSFVRGGQLGRIATQAWTVQQDNPSRPKYDGFGLPFTWTPAADATAFGSQPGDSVMTYFLRNAKQAAADATEAVRTAINTTLQQQQATLDQQAAQSRSALVVAQEAQGLCGQAMQTGNGSCVPATHSVTLPVTWTPLALTVNNSDGTTKVVPWSGIADPGAYCAQLTSPDPDPLRQLDCLARNRIFGATQNILVADPVAATLNASSAPNFESYAGGQIQSVLVDEWSALRRVQNATLELEATKKATGLRINAGQATIAQLTATAAALQAQLAGMQGQQQAIAQKLADASKAAGLQCYAAWAWLVKNGNQSEDPRFSVFDTVRDYEIQSRLSRGHIHDDSLDISQLAQLQAACLSARASLDDARLAADQAKIMITVQGQQVSAASATLEAARGNTLAEAIDGTGTLLKSAADIDIAIADVAKTVAQMSQLQTQSQLSVARAQLENALSAQSAQLSLGMYRQYNQYDWWRARALLDGARRYAVAARRAIETSYVVDLGTLNAPEPFVAAPASWAADVYRYDLSMPSAVGLSASQAISGAQYPNSVLDYVGNLERFVQGFAVERPMSAATDNQVLSLPGPGAKLVVSGQIVADPARATWSVLCPAGTTCATPNAPAWCMLGTNVPVAQTCQLSSSTATGAPQYVAPYQARVQFYLDSWGRTVAHDALTQLLNRANARWGRMMVNLVGNGIKDCSLSSNPADCQANQYLLYDLQHAGPSLALGATRQWMDLDVPLATIQAGKAASVGEFLDVQQNSWGKSFVEADARTDLIGRPLNGSYTLELSGGGGVAFDNVETVQILLIQNYSALQF
jgi:hypothetical protein